MTNSTNFDQLIFEGLIIELKDCTEHNCHMEAYIMASDYLATLGSEKAHDLSGEFRTFDMIHQRQGFLTSEQTDRRHVLYTEMNEAAKLVLTEAQYKEFYSTM